MLAALRMSFQPKRLNSPSIVISAVSTLKSLYRNEYIFVAISTFNEMPTLHSLQEVSLKIQWTQPTLRSVGGVWKLFSSGRCPNRRLCLSATSCEWKASAFQRSRSLVNSATIERLACEVLMSPENRGNT